MSDITQFISYLNQYSDLARSNRYKVYFTCPRGIQWNNTLSGSDSSVSENLSLQCESAELPGRTFAVRDTRTYGPSRKTPFQTTYNDLSLTFFCTGNSNNLLTFINRIATGFAVKGLSGIVGNAIASELGDLAGGFLKLIEGQQGTDNNGMWERQFFDDWMESVQDTENGSFNFNYAEDYVTNITVCHYDAQNQPTVAYKYQDAFPVSIEHQTMSWADDGILKLTVTFAYWKATRHTGPMGNDSLLMNPIANLIDTVATKITGSAKVGRIGRDLLSANPLARILNEF